MQLTGIEILCMKAGKLAHDLNSGGVWFKSWLESCDSEF